jgi:hypothetical protein
MKSPNPLITEHEVTEGSVLFSSSLGNVLIGCPPEILKVLMIKHIPMPDTIVLPGTMHHYNSSQACLEFPFYHFLFIQQGLSRGKKFRVLAKKAACEKLADMLRITLLGPDHVESLASESRLGLAQQLNPEQIKQIEAEVRFLAPKDKTGKPYRLDEMIEFIPFEIGDEKTVYDAYQDHPQVILRRDGEDAFTIEGGARLSCRIQVEKPQKPVYEIKATPISKTEASSKTVFSVRCLGASEGFDPTQPANGFLLHFNGKWFLWDCPAYLRQHLESIGLAFGDIDGIFISHVHEDHLDIMETIDRDHQTTVYSSPEIFHCMLLKLMAVLDCTYEQARDHYHFSPVYANTPFELAGASVEVFYSSHAIPALGLRLSVPAKEQVSALFISGDHLSQRVIQQLAQAGVYSKDRLQEVKNLLPIEPIYQIAFVDTGGGAIHGDLEDYANNANPVVYMHTGKKLTGFPSHHRLLKPGQRFIIHGR